MNKGLSIYLKIFLVLILVISICLSAKIAIAGDSKEPIKIGFPYPMTGPWASDGQEKYFAMQLEVERINAEGGLLGRQIQVIPFDTGSYLARDIQAAGATFAREGVDAILTGYLVTPVDVQILGQYDVPYLMMNTNSATTKAFMENPELYKNVVQLIANERVYGPNAYRVLMDLQYDYPNNKIAILSGDFVYNHNVRNDFLEYAKKDGWEIVVDDLHPVGVTEFGAQLARIRREDPAIIFANIVGAPSAAAFLNQFSRDPTNSIVYAQYTPSIPEYIEITGDNANGVVWQTAVNWIPGPRADEWLNRYRERFNREPAFCIAAVVHDVFNRWVDAVRKVGDPSDYDAIIKEIVENSWEGLAGKIVIDPKTHTVFIDEDDRSQGQPVHFYQIQNLKHVLLYLNDEPIGDKEFQIPPWIKK